jgi:hypothetical protein
LNKHALTDSDQLNQHRDHFLAQTDADLDNIERKGLEAIEKLAVEFGERLAILADVEPSICTSITSVKYEIDENQGTTPHDDANHGAAKTEDSQTRGKNGKKQGSTDQTQIIDPQASMDHLARLIDIKYQKVKDLFNEWDETQLDIILLAGEILGLKSVVLGDDLPDHFGGCLAQAARTRERHQAEIDEGHQAYHELEAKVKDVLGGIRSEVMAILKVSFRGSVRRSLTLLRRHIKTISRCWKRKQTQQGKRGKLIRPSSSAETRRSEAQQIRTTDLADSHAIVPGPVQCYDCLRREYVSTSHTWHCQCT